LPAESDIILAARAGGFCDDIGPAPAFPEQSRPTELAGTVQSTIV